MGTERKELRELSRKYPKLETLMNRVDYEALKEEHRRQSNRKAVEADGTTKEKYGRELDANLADLLTRMRTFSYRPQPVRRTYIRKANGKMRPLGIPAYEDKLVQGAMTRILNDIYEPRFLDLFLWIQREAERA